MVFESCAVRVAQKVASPKVASPFRAMRTGTCVRCYIVKAIGPLIWQKPDATLLALGVFAVGQAVGAALGAGFAAVAAVDGV